MATKAAAVDFSKILASGLGKETSAQIVAFRKRSEEARRLLNSLKAQSTTVDFAHYKKVLKVRDLTKRALSLSWQGVRAAWRGMRESLS